MDSLLSVLVGGGVIAGLLYIAVQESKKKVPASPQPPPVQPHNRLKFLYKAANNPSMN